MLYCDVCMNSHRKKMMQHSLPLNQMSTSEKLIILNQIWDNLIKEPDNIPSPEWHKEVLAARSERIKKGEAHFKEFNFAKAELQAKFK